MDEGSKMVLANPKYRTKAYIIKVRMVYSGKAQDIVAYKTCINNKYKTELQDTLLFIGM